MRVIADTLGGEVRLAASGDQVRRLFQVHELTGAPPTRLAAAARAPGVPRLGDAHPALPAVVVNDVRASATSDPSIAQVEVTYAVPTASAAGAGRDAVEIAVQSDLITEETVRDLAGNLILTSYTSTIRLSGTTGTGFVPTTPGVVGTLTDRQVHRVEVQRPTFSVSYARLERRAPLARAFSFAGTVNTRGFLGRDADQWLCNVESTQEADRRHRVRYTFVFNPNGWQARVTHTANGVIPNDVRTFNGEGVYQVYPRRDFRTLGLPAP